MFKRYPHTATLRQITETVTAQGLSGEQTQDTEIIGRFEPAGQSENLKYKGKYYCQRIDTEPFGLDGQKLIFGGKTFTIAQLHNYQSHCEIWLD